MVPFLSKSSLGRSLVATMTVSPYMRSTWFVKGCPEEWCHSNPSSENECALTVWPRHWVPLFGIFMIKDNESGLAFVCISGDLHSFQGEHCFLGSWEMMQS